MTARNLMSTIVGENGLLGDDEIAGLANEGKARAQRKERRNDIVGASEQTRRWSCTLRRDGQDLRPKLNGRSQRVTTYSVQSGGGAYSH
jgi:hypothetical protein